MTFEDKLDDASTSSAGTDSGKGTSEDGSGKLSLMLRLTICQKSQLTSFFLEIFKKGLCTLFDCFAFFR